MSSAAAARFDETSTVDGMLSYVRDLVVPSLVTMLRALVNDIEQDHLLTSASSNLVVHYTSMTTIESMLQAIPEGTNASLRLYDSVSFNDPEEGTYFDRILALPQEHAWLLDERGHSNHAYITSFIRPPSDGKTDGSDDLVFWLSYGDRGEGCSLKVAVKPNRLRKVLYGPAHGDRIREPLLPILEAIGPLAATSFPVKKLLASTVWESLETIRYLYKSEAHEHEKECRFVVPQSSVGQQHLVFRPEWQQHSLVKLRHYVMHRDLDARNIMASNSRITIGPSVAHPESVLLYLETLKQRAGWTGSHPEITVSRIPYRKS